MAFFNPYSESFFEDPYSTYARMLEQEPIHEVPSLGRKEWLVLQHRLVRKVLTDQRFSVDNLPQRIREKGKKNVEGGLSALAGTAEHWLLFLNPPEHGALRKTLAKQFAPSGLKRHVECIRELSFKLLSEAVERGSFDLPVDVGGPISTAVVARVLGVPGDDAKLLHTWSRNLFRLFERPTPLNQYLLMDAVSREMREYLTGLFAARKQSPGEDLISDLLSMIHAGMLTSDQALSLCEMVISVGTETTENLIGNGVLALARNPEARNAMCAGELCLNTMVEEMLRFDSPVQYVTRMANEDVALGSACIGKGERLVLALGSANRDPDVFDNPHVFMPNRNPNPHLAFAGGIHFCLGGMLARAQSREFFSVFRQFPNLNIEADGIVRRRTSITIRGIESLRMTAQVESA